MFPEKNGILHFYKGTKSIFDTHGVKRQIKSSFSGKTATLPSGALCGHDHTEAMHVIDVNKRSQSAEDGSGKMLHYK
ncbi:MAG: ribonuclease E/G [Saprospiraceae bacterium]|nr:ribonuclease E/G [Candidatus Vicinibacter affinis]